MKSIKNPHDKFIKTMLHDKSVAIAFLEEYLPSDLCDAKIYL